MFSLLDLRVVDCKAPGPVPWRTLWKWPKHRQDYKYFENPCHAVDLQTDCQGKRATWHKLPHKSSLVLLLSVVLNERINNITQSLYPHPLSAGKLHGIQHLPLHFQTPAQYHLRDRPSPLALSRIHISPSMPMMPGLLLT